ncbi:hypothetical protein J2X53_003429 [Pseudorhodobacter sp. 4114]|nr:hypothetical protein [Pseudorhodobacter sp. 4114]
MHLTHDGKTVLLHCSMGGLCLSLPQRDEQCQEPQMAISANSALHYTPENRGIFATFMEFFALIGAAIEASGAVQNGRQPSADSLAKLGIPADAFSR